MGPNGFELDEVEEEDDDEELLEEELEELEEEDELEDELSLLLVLPLSLDEVESEDDDDVESDELDEVLVLRPQHVAVADELQFGIVGRDHFLMWNSADLGHPGTFRPRLDTYLRGNREPSCVSDRTILGKRFVWGRACRFDCRAT